MSAKPEIIELKITESEQRKHSNSRLVADNSLILHTDIAQALFNGIWRPGRMGLIQFAGMMTRLWKAYKEDDPYAEKYLLKISDEIQNTREKFEKYRTVLQQQFNALRGLQINLFSHPEPPRYKLKFATPYPYMAAVLVEYVDYINRQIFTLKRIGMIPEEKLAPVDLMREVQDVFRIAMKWKYTGVTRKDILENNLKAKNAEKLLGEIPMAILNREIESLFL